MQRLLIVLIAVLFSLSGLLAQPTDPNYTTRKTTSPKAQKHYKEGIAAFRGNDLDKATKLFKKALNVDPLLIDAKIQIAAIFNEKADFEEAEKGFEEVLAIAPDHNKKVIYTLALMEMRQQKYLEAAAHFQQYLDSEKRNEALLKKAAAHLANCTFIEQALKNPVPFDPKSLGENINTEGFEYLPSLTADENMLIYTARVEGQEDFFISHRKDGVWQKGKALEAINTPLNEGAQSISADGKYLVFTACDRKDGFGQCDLYFSEVKGNRWTPAKNLGQTINTAASEKQPSISADGQSLYFSSNRKGGYGGLDIYVSHRTIDGQWKKPENIGAVINTGGNEKTPFIHADGQTLYFLSDGHPGMGLEDIFLSRYTKEKQWGAPHNLGYPINTKAHELAMVVSLDGQTAYFASNRTAENTESPAGYNEQGKQKTTDLYAFELYPEARPQLVTYVKAIVKDAETKKKLSAKVEFINLQTGETHVSSTTDQDGEFLICLPVGKDYALNVSKDKFLFHSENFALAKQANVEKPYLLNIDLHPIPEVAETVEKPSREIVLKNIFFDTGSANLDKSSFVELNRLVDLLEKNPAIRIQLNGHTDEVGDAAANLDLSERRAKAVYDYLIDRKVDAKRLRFKGYGESQPIDTNSTEEGRQNNRRTAFITF